MEVRDDAIRALFEYVEAIELVEPASVPRLVLGDDDVDHVIAVAARADLIVSGDRTRLIGQRPRRARR